MRITIFVKIFLTLLITFTLVFLLSVYISFTQFSPRYIEENISTVKESIIETAPSVLSGTNLEDTSLFTLARSETSFVRYQIDTITEELGPDFLDNGDVVPFVVNIYGNDDVITEGDIKYVVELINDVYHINYIYEYEIGDYLIVSTKIQSLTNVEAVLTEINIQQSIYLFIVITLLSIIISRSISKPLRKINKYADNISNLKFDTELKIKRNDEFKDLVSSLNEMTFNLKKTYRELNTANKKLSSDIDFEKQQEEKKKNLIMTINHELKTPLAVMKGMVEGMVDGVGRFKDREKYLPELISQIETIERITKDLTYSMMLEDKAKPTDVTNTKHIVDNLTSLEEFAKLKQIKINHKIVEEDININEELLMIIVTNLSKNAILYTEGNDIHIETSIKDSEYILLVKNKGEIPEKDLEKIFESFYRVEKISISKEGQGLGLFIVKQICELYGHTYKIFNDNGIVTAKITFKIKK